MGSSRWLSNALHFEHRRGGSRMVQIWFNGSRNFSRRVFVERLRAPARVHISARLLMVAMSSGEGLRACKCFRAYTRLLASTMTCAPALTSHWTMGASCGMRGECGQVPTSSAAGAGCVVAGCCAAAGHDPSPPVLQSRLSLFVSLVVPVTSVIPTVT